MVKEYVCHAPQVGAEQPYACDNPEHRLKGILHAPGTYSECDCQVIRYTTPASLGLLLQ
jgi:hypothetical protein